MADNSTFIAGSAAGSLKEAFDGLPPWATEHTANSIEKHLLKSLNIQTKMFEQLKKTSSSAGQSPEKSEKLNKELDKLIKNLADENKERKKSAEQKKAEEKSKKNEIEDLRQTSAKSKLFRDVLSKLTFVGTKAYGVFNQYLDVYDSIYQSGINVLNQNNSTTDGFAALNQMVNMTGLRLETLSAVSRKYSDTINAISVIKFANTIKDSNKRLLELGYSSTAQAELIATLMESETGYKDLRNRTASEMANDAVKLGSQLTKLSLTVGMSREQLQENLKAMSRNTDSMFVASKYGDEAAANVAKFASSIKDQNLSKAIQQMAAASAPVFTQVYQDLQAAGMGDLAVQLARIAEESRTVDPSEMQQRLKAFSETISDARFSAINDQRAAGNASAQVSADLLAGIRQHSFKVSEATGPQIAAATATEKSIAALQTEVERFSAVGQAAFNPMIEQVTLAADGFKLLNDQLYKAIGAVESETRSWVGAAAAVVGFVASIGILKSAISGLISLVQAVKGITSRGPSGGDNGGGRPGRRRLPGGKLKFGLGAMVGGYALDAAEEKLAAAGHTKTAAAAGIGSSALTFAGLGAFAGPIGAAIGGALGAAYGVYQNRDVLFSSTPKPSAIISPSSAHKPAEIVDAAAKSAAAGQASSTGIEKPVADAGINSILSYQNNVLEQLLMSTNTLVSVNKDILRYARIN